MGLPRMPPPAMPQHSAVLLRELLCDDAALRASRKVSIRIEIVLKSINLKRVQVQVCTHESQPIIDSGLKPPD